MTQEELDKKQEEAIKKMKELCKPGFYTEEGIDKVAKEGAEIINEWINAQIVKDVIDKFSDKK